MKLSSSLFQRICLCLTLCTLAFVPAALANRIAAAKQSSYSDTALWDRSDESNPGTIDHSEWSMLLAEYVVDVPDSPIRQFRYRAMDKQDLKRLNAYIRGLEKIDPREYGKREQLAYWMNLYNAVSVREIQPWVTAQGDQVALPATVWTDKTIKVARQRLSLNDIEHGILRPLWKDHRIHFGLNCGTMDCPNMDRVAFTGATIRDQLRAAGARFVNDDRGVHYADGKLTVARMFEAYRDDFAKDTPTLMKVFAHYAQDMKALYLLGYQGEIHYSQDLRLNSP